MTEAPAGCLLYAVLEAGEGAGARLDAALAAAHLAVVLIAPAAGQRLDAAEAKPLVARASHAKATALVLDDARLARTVGADGVHLGVRDDPEAACAAARAALGRDAVVGADAGISRHVAMLLAEAGADYVGFGAPPHLTDRAKARQRRREMIAWWAPLFEVACVAFDVETPEEAGELAAAGADFVAVPLPATLAPEAAGSLVAGAAEAIGRGLDA